MSTYAFTAKWPHPRIVLIDVDDRVKQALVSHGFRVTSGSYGMPYKVPMSDQWVAVTTDATVSFAFAEQEIVIVDLSTDIAEQAIGQKDTSEGTPDVWAKCNQGVIDPRPKVMYGRQDDAVRILKHGGIFIVFAAPRFIQRQMIGHIGGRNLASWQDELIEDCGFDDDNWSFLPFLHQYELSIKPDHGDTILVDEKNTAIHRLLEHYVDEAKFICTLDPAHPTLKERWTTLATNKYGAPVAGIISPIIQGEGIVLIFPYLTDKPQFLVDLLDNVLPQFVPRLFPHIEGARWVERPEYELPKIVELNEKIQVIEQETRARIVALRQEIEQERTSIAFLHDLLRETGDPLVKAVEQTLRLLGFQSIVNVDEELEASGDTRERDEDLRIDKAGKPLVLVEIKGVLGTSKDEDALQVTKHRAPRMEELKRFDIQGLSVINHQRNLPPLERTSSPFREIVISSATSQKTGLMTTWDLYRLARSFIRNGWRFEDVEDVFYRIGRVEPVPVHYRFLGAVERYIESKSVVGIRIEVEELHQGDRIAYELPNEYIEEVITSLQLDNKPVDVVGKGALAGIATAFGKSQIKEKVRVFRIAPRSSDMTPIGKT